jgi:hypothetical protein
MVLEHDRCRNDLRAERGRFLLLISDAAALGGVFGAETCGLHDHGSMMSLGSERTGYILCDIHAFAALVVQAQFACLFSAFSSITGSVLPRAEALRSIPRQAF